MADHNKSYSDNMKKTEILALNFGKVYDHATLYSILMSCDGDLKRATNVISSKTFEQNVYRRPVQGTLYNNPISSYSVPGTKFPSYSETMSMNVITQTIPPLPKMSYAGASMTKKKETISKQKDYSVRAYRKPMAYNKIWTEQFKRIVTYHNEGTRTLIIMRGPPGSGKSFLAKKLQEYVVGPKPDHLHIFSADDYFIVDNKYCFNKDNLQLAHSFNMERAFEALQKGVSPVIIDNTNIECWEMEPYARKGVANGYLIEIVEPEDKNAKNVHYLTDRNIHGVSASTIRKKIDRWNENPITTATVMNLLRLAYTAKMQPPVLRCIPEVVPLTNDCSPRKSPSAEVNTGSQHVTKENQKEVVIDVGTPILFKGQTGLLKPSFDGNKPMKEPQKNNNFDVAYSHNKESLQHNLGSTEFIQGDMNFKHSLETKLTNCNEVTSSQVNYAKFLTDYEKVENEWDSGKTWEDDIKDNLDKPIVTQLCSNVEAKLPRNKKPRQNQSSLDYDNDCQNMHRPLQYSGDSNEQSSILSKNVVKSRSTKTNIELGDTLSNIENQNENLSIDTQVKNLTKSANLNVETPQNIFHKSNIEHEQFLESGDKMEMCENENKHFNCFRNMFKNLDEVELRNIYDSCLGDINSAVNIVLDDSTANNNFECNTLSNQLEIEKGPGKAYNCTVNSNIPEDSTKTNIDRNTPSTSTGLVVPNSVRPNQKKKNPISDASLALKKQIEQNVVLSNRHCKNCLKYRKMRSGESDGNVGDTVGNINIGIKMENDKKFDTLSEQDTDTHHTDNSNKNATESSTLEVNDTEDSDDEPGFDGVEETVNIYLGHEFLNQLDSCFDRTDMIYPENIQPKINMPKSILNEINALWIESLMYQIDMDRKSREDLIKLDEEFAKELALKELEMSQSAMVLDVPNFKEIMDMEYALSLYRRDYEELLQKDRPMDLATKLSIKKLYDLFPQVPQKDLDEIYMAHNNSFNTTVTVILQSQGRCDILEKENGINKFIMAQELRQQELFLAAEEKRLKKGRWPSLTDITLKTVGQYRTKARRCWEFSEKYYKTANSKLNEHVQIAINYKRLSELYTFRYEQANNIAAAGILQILAKSDDTIDLHYLQSNEALQTVDIFLDEHIRRHKTPNCKKKIFNTLFIITGRGAHSKNSKAVLKPLTMNRLQDRGVCYSIRNQGVVAAYISARNLLTYEFYNRQ